MEYAPVLKDGRKGGAGKGAQCTGDSDRGGTEGPKKRKRDSQRAKERGIHKYKRGRTMQVLNSTRQCQNHMSGNQYILPRHSGTPSVHWMGHKHESMSAMLVITAVP